MTNNRLNSAEANGIYQLTASATCMKAMQETMKRRLGMTKTGMKNLRMATTYLEKCNREVLDSVPVEKQIALIRNAKHVRHKLFFKGDAGVHDGELVLITSDVFFTLLARAHEMCLWCDRDCNKCRAGKAFDGCLPHTRLRDESWAFIDLDSEPTDLNSVKVRWEKGRMK